MRNFKQKRRLTHWFDPWFGATRNFNSYSIVIIVYMTLYGGRDSNVDVDDFLSLLSGWD